MKKGYRVLNPKVGLLYGDSITIERQRAILWRLADNMFTADNLVLGIGSYSYQYHTRDTFGFAIKANNVVINGESFGIAKDPVTDSGLKKSFAGKVEDPDFELVYKDGELVREESFTEIRNRLREINMMKKKLYGKTTRMPLNRRVVITEKLDGSNLGFFKLDGELWIAQRSRVYKASNVSPKGAYKGLYDWIQEYGDVLEQELYEGSIIFGEWIGMGHIKYQGTLDAKYMLFGKARIDAEFNITKKQWGLEGLIYPFASQEIPSFIGVVPKVQEYAYVPSVSDLDALYEEYMIKKGRKVEGFVIVFQVLHTLRNMFVLKMENHLHIETEDKRGFSLKVCNNFQR